MSSLLASVLANSLAALPVALLVLLLERLAWRAGATYVAALWWCVLLRLMLPADLARGFTPELLPAVLSEPTAALAGGATATQIAGIWLGVALLLFTGGWRRAARCARRLAGEAQAVSPAIEQLARRLAGQLGLRRCPELGAHPDLTSPVVIGIWRPRVLVPKALACASLAIQQAALAHELAHVRRRDPLRSLVVAALRALFWFHPLAWVAAHRLQELREFACDRIAAQLTGGDARPYAQALASFALPRPVRAAPGLAWITGHALVTRRIERLLRPRAGGAGLGVASTLLCLALAVCCTPSRTAPAAFQDAPGCLQLRYAVLQLLAAEQPAVPVPSR